MLCQTINAGLLRKAAEVKNDEKILLQIRGKDCVAIEVRYHKVCYAKYTKFLTREQRDQQTTPIYEKAYEAFCTDIIEPELVQNKQVKCMNDLLSMFVEIAEKVDGTDASNYRAYKLKHRLQKRYPHLVSYAPQM